MSNENSKQEHMYFTADEDFSFNAEPFYRADVGAGFCISAIWYVY